MLDSLVKLILELELVRGATAGIHVLAEALEQRFAVFRGGPTKATRGLRLRGWIEPGD